MVVIGGMHNMLDRRSARCSSSCSRIVFDLEFELAALFRHDFVAFVLYSPGGLVGIWERFTGAGVRCRRSRAMSKRRIYARLAPARLLLPESLKGNGAAGRERRETVRRIRAVAGAGLTIEAGEIHALIGPNGAGKRPCSNLVFPACTPRHRHRAAQWPRDSRPALASYLPIAPRPLVHITNLFGGLSIYENLRLRCRRGMPMRFNIWRDIDSYRKLRRNRRTDKFLGFEASKRSKAATVLWRATSGGFGDRARLQAVSAVAPMTRWLPRPPSANASDLIKKRGRQHSGIDRRARTSIACWFSQNCHRMKPGQDADDRARPTRYVPTGACR